MEFLLCTLTPEVQCWLVHRNHVIWRTKITKCWQNGNDSKQRITTIYVRSYYSDGINGPRYDINSKWRGLCQIRSIFHELKLKLITNQFRVLIVIVIRLSSRHHVCSDHCFVLFCFVLLCFWFCLFLFLWSFLFFLFNFAYHRYNQQSH